MAQQQEVASSLVSASGRALEHCRKHNNRKAGECLHCAGVPMNWDPASWTATKYVDHSASMWHSCCDHNSLALHHRGLLCCRTLARVFIEQMSPGYESQILLTCRWLFFKEFWLPLIIEKSMSFDREKTVDRRSDLGPSKRQMPGLLRMTIVKIIAAEGSSTALTS